MGCFLGCFGLSSNKKRRRPPGRILPGVPRVGGYEPLDSASANLDSLAEPVNSESELNNRRTKETLNCKIRKKVSFNLNVQTYEPIPAPESDDEEKEASRASDSMAFYPQDYRYRNCIDCYDEEDEIAYEDSNLDDEDEDDYFDDSYDEICEPRISHEQVFVEQFDSLSISSQALTGNARDRSRYVDSVLNPVENLSQWKAVKAKGMPAEKRQRKENVLLEPPQQQKPTGPAAEVAVDASLSSWVVSSNSNQFKSESVNKCNNNVTFTKTCSLRNREDMPISDITNLPVNVNLAKTQDSWKNISQKHEVVCVD